MKRIADSTRTTRETEISIRVDLDGTGVAIVDLEPAFLKHMLEALSMHSFIDMSIKARGDLSHHVIEDTAMVLGCCMRDALDAGPYVRRFGYALVPMDCSRTQVCIDLAKRPFSVIDLQLVNERVEDMMTEDVRHFFGSFAQALGACLHIQTQCGENDHHKIESAFKAMAVALRDAMTIETRRADVPSSKGVL